MTQNLHHIVIVGGGAGGLELATQLGETFGKNGKAKITLVDQNLTHIWKPLLHEIAAGLIYAELSGDFPLGDSRQPIYKSLRPFDLVS